MKNAKNIYFENHDNNKSRRLAVILRKTDEMPNAQPKLKSRFAGSSMDLFLNRNYMKAVQN